MATGSQVQNQRQDVLCIGIWAKALVTDEEKTEPEIGQLLEKKTECLHSEKEDQLEEEKMELKFIIYNVLIKWI